MIIGIPKEIKLGEGRVSLSPYNIEELINKTESGFVCINGDDEKFLNCAQLLTNKPELRKRMGQNARSLLEDVFSVSRTVNQILYHFN